MTTGAPHRLPLRVVGLAARMLPAAQRDRYRREFTAELYNMARADALRHATQVLSRAWFLRGALREPAPGRVAERPVREVRRPLTCRLNVWHKWRRHSTEDGSNRYAQCAKCGKIHPDFHGWNMIGT